MQAGKAFWFLMQAVPALFCTGQAAQKGWTTDPRSHTDEIETKGTEHITPDFPSHAVSYTVKSNVTKWVVWMFELGVCPLTTGKISWLLGSPSKGQRANKRQLKQDHFSYEWLCEIPLITLTAFPLHTPQPCKQIKDSRSDSFPKPTVQSQTQTNGESWAFWYLYQSRIFTFGVFLSQLILTWQFSLVFCKSLRLWNCQSFVTHAATFTRWKSIIFLACQHQILYEHNWMMWCF